MNNDPSPNDLTESLVSGIVRDVIYAGAGSLAAHGIITNDQVQGFVGAGFFLVMIAFNSIRRTLRNAKIKDATK